MAKKRESTRRLVTRLGRDELKSFGRVKKYVVGFCGHVSDAEVLRFLIRNWLKSEHGQKRRYDRLKETNIKCLHLGFWYISIWSKG